ncbi:hypothetical protein AOLI_G00304140 [Acnodon oligacanthus]
MREKGLGVGVTLRTFEDIVVEGGRGPIKAVRHSMEDADRCSFSRAPQAKLEWQPECDKKKVEAFHLPELRTASNDFEWQRLRASGKAGELKDSRPRHGDPSEVDLAD